MKRTEDFRSSQESLPADQSNSSRGKEETIQIPIELTPGPSRKASTSDDEDRWRWEGRARVRDTMALKRFKRRVEGPMVKSVKRYVGYTSAAVIGACALGVGLVNLGLISGGVFLAGAIALAVATQVGTVVVFNRLKTWKERARGVSQRIAERIIQNAKDGK